MGEKQFNVLLKKTPIISLKTSTKHLMVGILKWTMLNTPSTLTT